MKSILISCGARLAPFDIAELREIMSDDELELDTLGDRKTALFLIMSDTDTTFNFVSLMQSIRSAIRGLQRWIADLNEKKQILLDALEQAKEPMLSDLLVDYFNLRNEQRSDWSGKAKLKCTVRDFEEVKRAVDYLKAHSLNTIEDLDR